MSWLRAHWNAIRLAGRRIVATPLNTALSVLGIGIALALPAGGQQLLSELASLTQGAAATPQLTLFLKVDGERKATHAVEARLKDRGDVGKVQILLREETLARMKSAEGLADVISVLSKNPFPDAIVVTPAGESPEVLEKLAGEVRQWKEVEHVQADADWARRFSALVRLARTGLLLLATLLGLGLMAITFNTVRLQAMTQRLEVEVSSLLGATDGFIRRPFLWHGGLLGLLGGGMAWLIVAATLYWLRTPVAELAGLYGFSLELGLPSAGLTFVMMAVSALLGWLGAALSMRQHLR
jgi:cell division transport system permease protein